jgi:hypothetical protein
VRAPTGPAARFAAAVPAHADVVASRCFTEGRVTPVLAERPVPGSRRYRATAKKQTIETLNTMLGTAWRFIGVESAGAIMVWIHGMPL